MNTDISREKQRAHERIEQLAPGQLAAGARLLGAIALDPLSRKVAPAPIDDEPETGEKRRALACARRWLASNPPIRVEEVFAEFGLTKGGFAALARV
jgi:hypothetical protein